MCRFGDQLVVLEWVVGGVTVLTCPSRLELARLSWCLARYMVFTSEARLRAGAELKVEVPLAFD